MAAGRLVLSAAISLTLCTSITPLVRAQEAPTQDVENAKQPWLGVVNASAVYVRSAAREDAYPVMKLDKGAQLKVVGLKFKWLKILPPDGSFAYVPKAYIERRGTGNVGRATREIIAKVGSSLNPMKINPMAKVEQGQDVQILGEQDEYYRIAPPEGSYLYINQQFVDPFKPLNEVEQPAPEARSPTITVKDSGSKAPEKTVDKSPDNKVLPATNPSGPGVAEAPSTQPADPITAASEAFDHIEAEFKAANEKPITEQPITELLASYQDLLKQDALPASMRRIAEVRVATLNLRNEAKQDFLATKAEQQKALERRKALEAERDEIQERIKQNEITVYAALGTLRTSSIQRGSQMLYRLTDPSTGRTICYIRTKDSKYAGMLGQFIGVKGTISTEQALNMKIIESPSEAGPVDVAKINKTITAQIIPPSLITAVRSASTNTQGEQ